jgi:predicted DNA-binding transcriptional regulator YafY
MTPMDAPMPDALFDDEDDELDDPPPDRSLTTSEKKLQRWVDLLAALLVRQRHATFDELAKDVPGYDLANAQRESVLRTFERDKDELREFGVPIDTIGDSDADMVGYRLERKAFYLPYLMVTGHERSTTAPRRVDAEGYRALGMLAFEPDELDAIIEAAARVRALGDPLLAAESGAAIRKLALDVPLGAVLDHQVAEVMPLDASGREFRVAPRAQADMAVFDRLADALTRHKTVTFHYYTMERGEQARRTVEPYGLFFVSSHWYLAGRDTDRGALRNFRLSRISRVDVNKKKPQSADYAVPPDFSLRDHAQSRELWEIGDGAVMTAVVEFRELTGATRAALRLGKPVDGSDTRRRFDVRRPDAFARWLLSFGGDVRPVEPLELCEEHNRVAAATLERYSDRAPEPARG